jgi:hypothetical protein
MSFRVWGFMVRILDPDDQNIIGMPESDYYAATKSFDEICADSSVLSSHSSFSIGP